MTAYLKAAALVLVLAACGSADTGTGLPQARFIDVVVELRRAALAGDPQTFDVRRQQILADAGVSEAELRAYVESHAADLKHMAAVWDSINTRVSEPSPE